MDFEAVQSNYLIIAGTEKSGTTSMYHYLYAHPEVSGSVRKETDYFRSAPPHTLAAYEALFLGVAPGLMCMEASPGYLADSCISAPAILSLIPDAKILFILRDPIDRLLSSFEFHKSRFFIPEDMSFDDYIDLCMRYESGEIGQKEAGLDDWILRVPDAGRYAAHLRDYETRFAHGQLKVLTLDRLKYDVRSFMLEICEWAGLDDKFYDDFEFVCSNVTFSPRRAWLQRVGLWANDALEPFLNRHPGVKQRLVTLYKQVNGQMVEKPRMSQQTEQLLLNYYTGDVDELVRHFGPDVAEACNWLKDHRTGKQVSATLE